MRIFKKHRKLYTAYAKTAVIAVLFLIVAVPFAKKLAAGDTTVTLDYTRYQVALNGETIGYVNDAAEANQALLDARTKLSNEGSGLSLVESNLEVTEVIYKDEVLTQNALSNKIYTALKADVVDTNDAEMAYTARIGDFTVTLASLDEIETLLEMVKDKYIETDTFSVELVQGDNSIYTSYKPNFVSADKTVNEAAQVLAPANGTESEDQKDAEPVYTEGVLQVGFVENIEVIGTKSDADSVISVEEAYELLTKEHAERGTYIVVSGDCLSAIANKCGLSLAELYAMNEGLNDQSVIYAGDVLTITVPASEISVKIVEEKAYDELYSGPVQYVDNNSLYAGVERVVQQGSKGTRAVVALITYVNGVEQGREIINEKITQEATTTIIERGTLIPPTYIWPVYSTYITQWFGQTTFGSPHTGVDIFVPSGTAVKADAAGTVCYAGWMGGLGYVVEIKHNNGMVTRYAHLSSIPVYYGQWVNQGQVVAYSGATGRVTGAHLHVSMIYNGYLVNPLDYLRF